MGIHHVGAPEYRGFVNRVVTWGRGLEPVPTQLGGPGPKACHVSNRLLIHDQDPSLVGPIWLMSGKTGRESIVAHGKGRGGWCHRVLGRKPQFPPVAMGEKGPSKLPPG